MLWLLSMARISVELEENSPCTGKWRVRGSRELVSEETGNWYLLLQLDKFDDKTISLGFVCLFG